MRKIHSFKSKKYKFIIFPISISKGNKHVSIISENKMVDNYAKYLLPVFATFAAKHKVEYTYVYICPPMHTKEKHRNRLKEKRRNIHSTACSMLPYNIMRGWSLYTFSSISFSEEKNLKINVRYTYVNALQKSRYL